MDIVEILYSAGETGNGLIKVFGMVGTVLSAVSALRNLFKGNKTVAYRSLCVALILVFVTLINSSRIRVPDVTGLFFDDARRTLLELDLKYSGMMDDNCSVERQSPVAGTVVKKRN